MRPSAPAASRRKHAPHTPILGGLPLATSTAHPTPTAASSSRANASVPTDEGLRSMRRASLKSSYHVRGRKARRPSRRSGGTSSAARRTARSVVGPLVLGDARGSVRLRTPARRGTRRDVGGRCYRRLLSYRLNPAYDAQPAPAFAA